MIVNQLKYIGPSSGGISKYGNKTDELKSGLQKYIRRGMTEKALFCIIELDKFAELLGGEQDKMIKAFMTNIMNRLIIISVEDIGIGNYKIIEGIEKLRQLWDEIRNDKNKATLRTELVLTITNILSKSPKSREISHIRVVYWQILNSRHFETYKNKYKNIYSFDINSDNYIEEFRKSFDSKSDSCFYWFFKLLYSLNEKGSVKPVLPILKHIIDREKDINKIKIYQILLKWFKNYKFKEFWIFACQIILISLRYTDLIIFDIFEKLDTEKLLDSYNKHSYILDDFCYDKHTKKGKFNKKSNLDFAIEGSKVDNESKITNQLYKSIYIDFRSCN